MKNVYQKPMLYAEAYMLVDHISQSCAYQTNFGNQCPIADAGVVFFTSVDAGCNDDGVSMFEFAGIDPADATIEDLLGMNIRCYNSLRDYNQLFTS